MEEVLQWQSQKEIDPLKLEELKDKTENIYPFYGQATLNNGIISYHQLTKNVLNNEKGKPTILIHSNNQNIVFLETPFYLKDGHGATSVLQSEKLNKTNQMFILASIDRVIKSKYSYNHKATKIELKNTVIKLPTKNGKIDFDFMENFIAELEAERIAELEAYLLATGLKNYELTSEEEKVLAEFESGEMELKKVKIEEVFEVKTVKGIDEGKLNLVGQKENSCIEFVGRTRNNNGIKGYVQKLEIEPNLENVISVSQIGTIVAQLRKEKWYGSQNIFALSSKDPSQPSVSLYSVAVIEKSLSETFSAGYSNYPTLEKLKNLSISLPTKNQKPDFSTMETFISAIQKLVIKDVVRYADRKIAGTREVLGR